ncbi:MAG: DUF4102 domain-containing protein [Alphaproteobacteria bacterium]|nr:DUF4102 domain-containing protein [Alphaproteobacteria bacterium]
MVKINKSFIDKITEKDIGKTFWDDSLKGFGIRIQPKSKSWVIMYRNQFGKQKMFTLGKVGKITPEQAREKAQKTLADITLNHGDPALEKTGNKKAITITELCEIYMDEATYNKKNSTIINDRSRIERHIKPLIGNMAVKELQKEHIDKMVLSIIKGDTAYIAKSSKKRGVINVKGGKSIAKRTLEMLSSILSFAKLRGYINENPALGIKKPKTNKREEFLTIDEIKLFGKALTAAEELHLCSTTAINALKLLILTGCRKNEILTLKWDYVDFKNQCFRFPDTKTGAQIRPFGYSAKKLLEEIKEQNNNYDWVFPATRGSGHLISLLKIFNKIYRLPTDYKNEHPEQEKTPFISKDICLHTLRHSFASVGADMNYNELTIAGLLGHKLGGVTNRYSHSVDASLVYAADAISKKIAEALEV